MTTRSDLAVKLPALPTQTTPCATASMTPQDIVDHRAEIVFDVDVILSGYWQDNKMAPKLRTAILADWADELEDWHLDQVRWALREWRRENPRLRPNPGDILRMLKDRYARIKMAAWRAEADEVCARASAEAAAAAPPPVSPERRAEISAEVSRMMGRVRAAHGIGGRGGA